MMGRVCFWGLKRWREVDAIVGGEWIERRSRANLKKDRARARVEMLNSREDLEAYMRRSSSEFFFPQVSRRRALD